MRVGSRRRDGERGAVLIETALVIVPLALVLGGIIDFGHIYEERISLRTGVREASWNAGRSIYGAPEAAPSCTLVGGSTNANARRVACMAKRRAEVNPQDIRVRIRLVTPTGTTPASFSTGNLVMVCVMHRVRSLSGLYSAMLGTKVERMRLENVILDTSGGTLPSNWNETAFPGSGGWSWCDPTQAATP